MALTDLKRLLSKKEVSSLIGDVSRSLGISVCIRNAAGEALLGKEDNGSRVSCPLEADGEVVGRVSGDEKATVIASLLGYMLRRDAERRALGRETLDKYREATLLYAFADGIVTCLEPEKAADFIIEEVKKMIRADNVSIMLLQEDGVLSVLAASGGEYNPKTTLRPGEGVAGHVFQNGRAEIVNELTSDRRFVPGANKACSLMCAPLKISDQVIGVMNVSSNHCCDYSAEDLKLLTTFASLAASAIEVARLYDAQSRLAAELKESNEDLEAAREMLASENVNLRQNLRQKFSPARILGISSRMREVLANIEKIADLPVNVLITGETGTGKELVAKAIHYNSGRANKPFVAINCSAIPEAIFESEMFGIEKGVATGVDKRMGKIEQARGGTLFLDELGDMPLSTQVKMLRVIESRELQTVGGREPIPVDVRILAATNKDLKKEVETGAFRGDLFYRLNVVKLHVPPLRERKEDIPVLLHYFIEQCGRKFGRPRMRFAPGVVEALTECRWPGNVRELENEVERAIALSTSNVIALDDISEEQRVSRESPPAASGTATISESERLHIEKALAEAGGNKSKTARALGLSREGLRKKMKRYEM